MIGGIAFLVFSPVLWSLADDGGYRAVQENHARYLVGLSGWTDSFTRQLANHRFFDGPLSWLGLFLAVLCSRLVAIRDEETPAPLPRTVLSWLWAISWAAFLAMVAMWLGTSLVLGLLGMVWLIAFCPWWRREREESNIPKELAYWLMAAWFVGLFLSTPFYTAYPRLSLPWLMAAWITAAAMIGSAFGRSLAFGQEPWQSTRMGTACLMLLGLSSVLVIVGKFLVDSPRPPAMWDDRTGLESIAKQIHQVVLTRYSGEAVVYVYAEPGLFFHLKAGQLQSVGPVADLGFADQPDPFPILLAAGPHAQRSESFQIEFQKDAERWELLEEFPYLPSRMVLLDHDVPEQIQRPAVS